ncbi:MAG: hypothetical protein LBG05_09145 [Treponema sp.]|nr:hypothetical protein [Treponema sp.]
MISLDIPVIIRILCGFSLSLCPLYAEETYMVPQTVYVGDRAMLIAPLSASNEAFQAGAPEMMSIDPPAPTTGLVVHRIVVERQNERIRLAVEFTAFETGVLELPPITVPGFADDFHLSVTVASLLSPSTMSLSPPAPPLAVSGTAALLYGTSIALILVIFLFVGARVFWIRQFLSLSVLFKDRLLIFRMKRRLANLRKNLQKDGIRNNQNEVLDNLSVEFRLFLSHFFNIDCSTLTADEFSFFPLSLFGRTVDYPQDSGLRMIFRRLDSFRFNMEDLSPDNVRMSIEDIGAFIEKLWGEMRRKP